MAKSCSSNLLVRFAIEEVENEARGILVEAGQRIGQELPTGGPNMAFAYIACGADQAGAAPARLNLIQCTVVAPTRGLQWPVLLQYPRRAEVRVTSEVPLGFALGFGMLSHFTLDDWCDFLMAPSSDEAQVSAVKMELLSYTEVGADKFQVVGIATPEASKFVALAGDVAAREPGHMAPPSAPSDQSVGWDDVLPKHSAGRERKRSKPAPRQPPPPTLVGVGHNLGDEEQDAAEFGMPDFAEELSAIIDEGGMAMVQAASELAGEFRDSEAETSSSDEDPFDGVEEAAPSSGVAASSSSAPVAIANPPVSAATCWHALRGVQTAAEVQQRLPGFVCSNSRWETTIAATGEVLGKVRMIDGKSLRADCRRHHAKGRPCKLHCNIVGRYHHLDAELSKWLVAGSAMSEAEHRALAIEIQDSWRQL